MITNFQIQYEYYGYTICMKPFTLTPRDIGAVHILCVISCVNQFMNYLDHTVSIYRPPKMMFITKAMVKGVGKIF